MSLANRRQFLQTAAFMAGASGISKSASQESQRARWLETAERLKPRLHAALVRPVSLVNPLADSTQFLRWRMDRFAPADRLHDRLVRRGDFAILDFGRHLTGRLRFSIEGEGRGIDAPNAPEIDIRRSGSRSGRTFRPLPYHGTLSLAWLQDEGVNIDVFKYRGIAAPVCVPVRKGGGGGYVA